MNPGRMLKVLVKDLSLGPRSPFFLYTIALPVVLTIVFQLAFGSLFAPKPRLALFDEGRSELTEALSGAEGIELTILADAEALRRGVRENDFDAGLILPARFDEEVRAGRRPTLQFHIGGESHASNRIILTITALDLVRDLDGAAAPVEVEIVEFGEASLPIALRLVPVIVFYALALAGIFVPGSSLVEEKEQGTLMALLVTPVRAGEVLTAKWLLGLIFATVMSLVALALNGAMGARPLEVVLVVMMAAALTSMIGVLVGVLSKDSAMLFGMIKGMGIVLFAPALFYLFPSWPQWIAMIFPLYWVIEPVWQVAIMGRSITTVWMEMAIALGITAAMLPVLVRLSRRMLSQMAAR
jgi:ABC-2 type transport system permease protein